MSSMAKIQNRLEAIEPELFVPYARGLKQQAANKNNPLPRNNSSTPEPIEDIFLLKLLALKPLIQDDRALYQHFQSLIQSLKGDFKVMRHCVDCIKLWYLHDQSEKDPFAVPCNRPHLLVWVKRENYFWPAKLISSEADKVLISYFGTTRFVEMAPFEHVLLLTKDYPEFEQQTPHRKSSYRSIQKEFQNAMMQLNTHVTRLNLLYADSPLQVYHSFREIRHVKEYIATYGLHLVRKRKIKTPYEISEVPFSFSGASSYQHGHSDHLYNRLMDEGSINIAHLNTLAAHPKMQLVIELDQFDASKYTIVPENPKNSSNTVPSQMLSDTSNNMQPQIGPTSASLQMVNIKKESSPVSDSCEISSIEPDSTDHSNHLSTQIYGSGESTDHNISWSCLTGNSAIPPTDCAFMVSTSSSGASNLEPNQMESTSQKIVADRLMKLRQELELQFAERCAAFNPEQDIQVKFKRLQLEKELSQAKRTTWCSVCSMKPANTQLSLDSANKKQWHPYQNNYAFCSTACKSKRK